jgi:hypothetical protein
MKKIVFMLAFILIAVMAFGQSSIVKQFTKKTLTSTYAITGKDSVTYTLQGYQDWSLQIIPKLAAGSDSIYTSVKVYVSNSDGANTQTTDLGTNWTLIRVNDNAAYTSSKADTLLTTHVTANGNAWLYNSTTAFYNVRIKVVLLCLDNTNESNVYYMNFVTKPSIATVIR